MYCAVLSRFGHVWLSATCGLKSTGLFYPWDSPGKNTGVSCWPSSRGSSRPRDWTHISGVFCIAGRFFTHWATWEAQTHSMGLKLSDEWIKNVWAFSRVSYPLLSWVWMWAASLGLAVSLYPKSVQLAAHLLVTFGDEVVLRCDVSI